jgi:hypothetical protein
LSHALTKAVGDDVMRKAVDLLWMALAMALAMEKALAVAVAPVIAP